MLRWNVQRGVSIVSKSSQITRIAENLDIFDFELSATEVNTEILLLKIVVVNISAALLLCYDVLSCVAAAWSEWIGVEWCDMPHLREHDSVELCRSHIASLHPMHRVSSFVSQFHLIMLIMHCRLRPSTAWTKISDTTIPVWNILSYLLFFDTRYPSMILIHASVVWSKAQSYPLTHSTLSLIWFNPVWWIANTLNGTQLRIGVVWFRSFYFTWPSNYHSPCKLIVCLFWF